MDDRSRSAKTRFSGPRWGVLALVILAGSSYQWTLATSSSPAYDKPLHLALGWLVLLSLLSLFANRFLHPEERSKSLRRTFASIRAALVGGRDASTDIDLGLSESTTGPRLGGSWRSFVALFFALSFRAAIFKQTVQNSECLRTSLAAFIPAALASIDALITRRRQRYSPDAAHGDRSRPATDHVSKHKASVVACWLYGFGVWALESIRTGPNSTYICSSSESVPRLTPVLQHVGTVLDIFILYCVLVMMYQASTRGRDSSSSELLNLLSAAFMACAVLIASFGIGWYLSVPEDRTWVVSIPFRFFWAALKLDFLLCITCVAFAVTFTHFGYTATLLVVSSSTLLISGLFEDFYFALLHSPSKYIFGFVVAFGGLWLFTYSTLLLREQQDYSRRTPRRILTIGTLIILFWGCSILWRKDVYLEAHPIDELVTEASLRQEAWTEQASSSHSLAEAVGEYHRRYQRYPPPGFGEWYNFAVSRKSLVIDDFDGIMRDIAPFEQYSPKVLRLRTWEAMSNPDDDISGLSIRNGKATLHANVRGTHRWMVEGVLEMIKNFEQHLPDMDIGFNENDEPRVMGSVNSFAQPPYPHAKYGDPEPPKSTKFSTDRGRWWDAAQTNFVDTSPVFDERALVNNFHDYAASACPSSSSSSNYLWDASRFCSSCTTQHSHGIFFSNWTSSTDVCNQPDLARQHGFYASPSAFKGSHTLYPVFSQSKAPFFADILYPSAWNYLDKALYAPNDDHPDPPFAEKNRTLFWRGATTEGLTHHRAWHGFTRQRFVDLSSSPAARAQLLLLPQSHNSKWGYMALPAAQLQSTLRPDVRLTDVVRCHNPDCPRQKTHFAPLAPAADFQRHWGYAFLLDLDGAGFSGRFLPFLRSRSLPFKAALFREWYDDRVRAWAHFVPLDLRGQGFWATLAFFTGFGGGDGGRRGEEIAAAGKEWAERVLRREDMEVYMFRLLLEWGRLTDDARGEIGFVLG